MKRPKGFALLFAVLAASLLLSIGLSIFLLTVKELALSSYTRDSQFSFYAADSGAECALYWDLKQNQSVGGTFATSSYYGGVSPYQINCGNTTVALVLGPTDGSDATTTFAMPLNDVPGQSYCALVIVSKSDPNHTGISSTNISSSGYNICDSSANPAWGNQNLVERTLYVSY